MTHNMAPALSFDEFIRRQDGLRAYQKTCFPAFPKTPPHPATLVREDATISQEDSDEEIDSESDLDEEEGSDDASQQHQRNR